MKLTSVPLALIIFGLLFGGIGFTSAMNWWHTETQKVPVKYSEGDAAGQYNPADIRGSYTFGEISDLFDVPMHDLQVAFRIPPEVDPVGYQLKSLETQFADLPVEIGTGSVRMFVAFYKGLPYDLAADEDTYLLPEAVEILKAQAMLQTEQAVYLENHVALVELNPIPVATSQPAAQTEVADPTPVPTEHVAPDKTVTGKTTFQDLLDWGVTQAEIESVLGESMPAPMVAVKDYASQKGETFSGLKSQLQAVVDSHK